MLALPSASKLRTQGPLTSTLLLPPLGKHWLFLLLQGCWTNEAFEFSFLCYMSGTSAKSGNSTSPFAAAKPWESALDCFPTVQRLRSPHVLATATCSQHSCIAMQHWGLRQASSTRYKSSAQQMGPGGSEAPFNPVEQEWARQSRCMYFLLLQFLSTVVLLLALFVSPCMSH